MRTSKNILKHELIGLETEVVGASNKSLVGIHGKIVDETKFTLALETEQGEKKVLKKGAKLKILVEDGKVVIDGTYLVGRPEDRIKK